MNQMNLYQAKFQDVQEFRDKYVAMKKVCDELGLCVRRCEEDAKAILMGKGLTNPTQEQLKKTLDDFEEEHHAIHLCARSIGRITENWWNKSKTTCFKKIKIHFQKDVQSISRMEKLIWRQG